MSNLFTVNHAEAKSGFEPLPIGEYECVISEVKIGKSEGTKTAGCDKLDITLTVREDIEQEGKKRKFFDSIIFAPSLGWKIQQFFKACAFEDGKSFNTIQEVAQAVAYRSVRIKNKHEVQTVGKNAGRTNDKIDFYKESENPLNGVGAPGAAGFDPFATTDSGEPSGNPFGTDEDTPF